MRYMLLIYTDESLYGRMSEAEMQADMTGFAVVQRAIHGRGSASLGDALQPTATATTVTQGGKRSSPRPFGETKEQLGGYYLIDVENLDAAKDGRSSASGGSLRQDRVRPFQESIRADRAAAAPRRAVARTFRAEFGRAVATSRVRSAGTSIAPRRPCRTRTP